MHWYISTSNLDIFTTVLTYFQVCKTLLEEFDKEFEDEIKNRKAAGRPIGSTNKKKRQQTKLENKAKYNVISHYIWETQNINKSNPINKKEVFHNILQQAKQHYDLSDSFSFPYPTALSSIRRGRLKGNGNDSPLLVIEPKNVELAISLVKTVSSYFFYFPNFCAISCSHGELRKN